jgi:hypothetical protein
MKKLLFITLVALVSGCSSVKVSYDYDKTKDFTKFKTYAYTEDALALKINDLNRDRLIKAVDQELAARGMTKSSSPDVLIDLIVKAEQKMDATATNTGGYYGRYGYAGGFGGTTHISYNEYVEGTLFINMVEKAIEKIVWQGVGTRTIDETASPEKRETNINYAVKTIFTKYPVKPIVASK